MTSKAELVRGLTTAAHSSPAEHHTDDMSHSERFAPDRRTALLFVAGQFALLALIIFIPSSSVWTIPTWLVWILNALAIVGLVLMAIAALGLGRGLTAMPIPNEHAQLRTGGLYRWVRHPIYSGLLLFALCRTLTSGNLIVLGAFILLTVLLTFKARWEEQQLTERFPEYPQYAARTGRFVPRLRSN